MPIDQSDAARVERFVREYLIDHNGKQAAIRAGYSSRSASVQASRMLTRSNVRARLAELEQELQERTSLSAERVRDEYLRLLEFTPKLLLRPDGSPIPLHELPDKVAACIASVDYETKAGGENQPAIRVTRMRFWNRNQAMDMAARITGLIKDPKLVVDMNPLRELMDRISTQGSGLPSNPLPSGRQSRG